VNKDFGGTCIKMHMMITAQLLRDPEDKLNGVGFIRNKEKRSWCIIQRYIQSVIAREGFQTL
jgi:hypothetical protein